MRKLVLATGLLTICSSLTLMARQFNKTSAPKAKKNILVTYFTLPESDGVDASTRESQFVARKRVNQ